MDVYMEELQLMPWAELQRQDLPVANARTQSTSSSMGPSGSTSVRAPRAVAPALPPAAPDSLEMSPLLLAPYVPRAVKEVAVRPPVLAVELELDPLMIRGRKSARRSRSEQASVPDARPGTAIREWLVPRPKHARPSMIEGAGPSMGPSMIEACDDDVKAERACPAPHQEPASVTPTDHMSGDEAITGEVLKALAHGRECMRQCVLPSRSKKGFASTRDREAKWIAAGAHALVTRLPDDCQLALAGGQLALEQMGGAPNTVALAAAVIRSRAGRNGDKLFDTIKLMAYASGYAEAMGMATPWPMSKGLTWLLVRGEHLRATTAAKGTRGGASVADRLRATIIWAESVSLPIQIDKLVLDSAAPRPAAGGNDQGSAATIPFKWECKMEWVASHPLPSPQRFWTRSLLQE